MALHIILESTLVDRDGNPILGPDGKPVDRIVKPTNSWVKQFPQIMKSCMQEISEAGVLDTSGASLTVDRTPGPILDASPAAGDNTHGIQLGTSNVAPTSTDNALGALIASGAGAGQLDYQVQLWPGTASTALIAIAGGVRIVGSRQVDNNSGGLITVEEIGLAVRQRTTTGIFFFLILRDLITSAIPDGTSRVFTYNLEYLV